MLLRLWKSLVIWGIAVAKYYVHQLIMLIIMAREKKNNKNNFEPRMVLSSASTKEMAALAMIKEARETPFR